MLCAICCLLVQYEFQKHCYTLLNILWPLQSQSVRQISPVRSLFCSSLYSHVCEPNLFWKVLENEFCESWKTLEFGLCKSWKVLKYSILLSV